jgi:hypothetical protein
MTKIKIDADIPDRWVPYFISMLQEMENLGANGSSRYLCFNSDGDGDFHPKFTIKAPEEIITLAEGIQGSRFWATVEGSSYPNLFIMYDAG